MTSRSPAKDESGPERTKEVSEVAVQPLLYHRKSKVKKGEGLWLMSFSDMSLILMSFFILQLSFSSPDRRKYDNLSTAIKKSEQAPPVQNLETISQKVRHVIKARNLEKVAEVSFDVNGLAVEFKDRTLFAPGVAVPDPKTAVVVDEVMKVLADAPPDYKLIFEGHTDDLPIASSQFRSNWDLAAARGISLLRDFKKRGVDENRMSVRAYASTRPKLGLKGLSGDALRAARAANRRVVIRLE